MADYIVMPKLGLTMTEGSIRDWKVKEGDPIAIGDLIFEIETDKITKAFESAQAGTLLKILVPEGVVKVQGPVAIIGQPGEDFSALLPKDRAEEPIKPPADISPVAEPGEVTKPAGAKVKISPKARKLAEELGVDYTALTGTGPGGAISAEDIEKAAKQPKATPMAAYTAQKLGVDLKEVPAEGRIRQEDVERFARPKEKPERESMSRMRQIIAQRMKESQDESATVNFTVGVDMTGATALRESLKETAKISFTDILVLITARTLKDYPLLNASVEGNEIVYHGAVHMGIAVAVEEGLMVPVLRGVDTMGLQQIAEETAELATGCRDMSINPDLLEGSTFTLSNLGMFGMEAFTPIINQPNVAILGINAIIKKPVVVDDEITIRPMMNLSLTADHRIVDGAVAAQFLKTLKERIEQPALLLL